MLLSPTPAFLFTFVNDTMKITSIKTLVALCALHNTRAAFLSEGTSLGERAFAVGQSVQTSSGLVTGQAASNRTQVSEYLGIPFAQPPTGILRFAAPEKFSGSGKIQATTFVCYIARLSHS